MKRSRRVVLTMMGSGAIGAVSMGFVGRNDCDPGVASQIIRGFDGRPHVSCQAVAYGGFGGFPRHFHAHGHGHGHGHGG
ncbi:MAG TPA: hypothetical protein VFK01_05125 [Bradyrhizobium sp.]|nr:hypothetical protein [Bradyrhizobium sp.]